MKRPRVRLRLRGRLLLGTLLPLTLVAVAAIFAIGAFTSALEDREAASDSQQTIVLAANVVQDVIDAETGMRGYVITSQPSFLEPYVRGTREFATSLGELVALLAGEPAQLERAREVIRAFDEWRTQIAGPVIAAVEAGDQAAAETLLASGEGKARTDRIRQLVNEITAAERAVSAARDEGIRAQAVGARRVLFYGTFVAIVLGAIIAVVFARRLSRRVRILATASATMAGEDLETRVPVTGADEITELAVTFNAMADRLERAFADVQRTNADLARRTAETEQANRELETFSYSVSHDLRAPLRSIDGFSQALIEDYGEGLDETAHGYLARVRAATQRMGVLIDDLLRLSRLSREQLQPEPVDLSALATEVVNDLRQSDPGRTVEVEMQAGIQVMGDRRLLRVALQNLLGNAWKFTRDVPAAKISLFTEHGPDGPEIVVADHGAGFDMRYADKLFGPFQRLHDAAQFEGTGIGLATVQRIVHRHGGTIRATADVGRGATFRFTLGTPPAGPAQAAVGGIGANG